MGCATPQPLVRLTPANEPVVWVAGRATLTAENDGIRVGAAFEHQDGAILGLRVEVQNGTDQPLQIDPAEITFTPCATAQTTSCQPARAVIDPERMLAALAAKRSIEVAETANDEAFHSTLVILSAASLRGNAVSSSVAAAEASATHHDLSQMNTTAQQQLWADVALRRNTVLPGHGVGGRVFIPVNLDARYVWLRVEAGDQHFTFRFVQTVVPVKANVPVASSTSW
jgi:hypothetical protein